MRVAFLPEYMLPPPPLPPPLLGPPPPPIVPVWFRFTFKKHKRSCVSGHNTNARTQPLRAHASASRVNALTHTKIHMYTRPHTSNGHACIALPRFPSCLARRDRAHGKQDTEAAWIHSQLTERGYTMTRASTNARHTRHTSANNALFRGPDPPLAHSGTLHARNSGRCAKRKKHR